MQNPFTTTFSKTPEYTYIRTEETEEILENFQYDHPSESVYKITGVRGSGKTVILSKVEEELRKNNETFKDWLVFDVNPSRDILQQLAALLSKAGFGPNNKEITGVNLSATVLGSGGSIGYSSQKNKQFFDIGIEVEEMIQFASEYGRWLRANYPVYFVCTGLYENIQDLSNVKNLTFFRRATTIKTEPLNFIRMSQMYNEKLNIPIDLAREMAKSTKGYAYAFQELGVLCFKKKEEETIEDLVSQLKIELFAYSYEKIWDEMTEMDRFLAKLLTDKEEYKREEVLKLMKEKSKNYSMYRDRLIKRGILSARQGYISLALPYFSDFIKEYCL